jgi:hypothetical protein
MALMNKLGTTVINHQTLSVSYCLLQSQRLVEQMFEGSRDQKGHQAPGRMGLESFWKTE